MTSLRYLDIHPELMKDVTLEVARVETEMVETEWYNGLELGRLYGPGYPDLLMWQQSENLQFLPAIHEVILSLELQINERLCPTDPTALYQVMVNHLNPDCIIGPHKDGPPANLRFHLPVITNPRVEWWDEINGTSSMVAGVWYGPVNYSGVLHSMSNRGSTVRTHIIADFCIL